MLRKSTCFLAKGGFKLGFNMNIAHTVASMIVNASSVEVYQINLDGSRGEPISGVEWETYGGWETDFDLSSFRIISSSGNFELWYDECDQASIEKNLIRVKDVEISIS